MRQEERQQGPSMANARVSTKTSPSNGISALYKSAAWTRSMPILRKHSANRSADPPWTNY